MYIEYPPELEEEVQKTVDILTERCEKLKPLLKAANSSILENLMLLDETKLEEVGEAYRAMNTLYCKLKKL